MNVTWKLLSPVDLVLKTPPSPVNIKCVINTVYYYLLH